MNKFEETTEERHFNISKIFEALMYSVYKSESIKIEYLNDEGEMENFIIDKDKAQLCTFSFNFFGYINISTEKESIFHEHITDIQSITSFRKIELKFREENKD